MDSGQRARMKEYVERWKRVGPLLEAQREADVRQADTLSAFSFFAGMPKRTIFGTLNPILSLGSDTT